MLELTDVIVQRREKLFQIEQLILAPGDFVALIGANGSGKSTLLKYLTGELKLEGSARWLQTDIVDLKAADRSRLIAKVDNTFSGLDHMSTREYLSLGRFPYTGAFGFLSQEDDEIVARYALEFKLTHLLDQPSSQLSDGERQRAGIARAMIQETPIILLDEPTSFLDFPGKINVMKLLREVAISKQKVVLIATHDLDLALDYCTSWLIIRSQDRTLKQLSDRPSKESLIQIAFPQLLP